MFNSPAFSKKGSRKGLVVDALAVGVVGVWWYEFCGDIQMFDVSITAVVPTTVTHITHDGMIVLADAAGALFEISYAVVL